MSTLRSSTPQFSWKKIITRECGLEQVFCESVVSLALRASLERRLTCIAARPSTRPIGSSTTGLAKLPHTLCFAVKSNGNLSILNHLAKRGSGFDIVSGGELDHLAAHRRARRSHCVFRSVAKMRQEIREALQLFGVSGKPHAKRPHRRNSACSTWSPRRSSISLCEEVCAALPSWAASRRRWPFA